MNKLPKDVLNTIRGYASDTYKPSPTAQLIKTLEYEYKPTSNNGGVFRPYRLEVTATDGHFNLNKYYISSTPERNYIISDLLPSYWSFYANTMDRNING